MILKIELQTGLSQFMTYNLEFDTEEQMQEYKNFLIDLTNFMGEDKTNVDLTEFKQQFECYNHLEILLPINEYGLSISNIIQ